MAQSTSLLRAIVGGIRRDGWRANTKCGHGSSGDYLELHGLNDFVVRIFDGSSTETKGITIVICVDVAFLGREGAQCFFECMTDEDKSLLEMHGASCSLYVPQSLPTIALIWQLELQAATEEEIVKRVLGIGMSHFLDVTSYFNRRLTLASYPAEQMYSA